MLWINASRYCTTHTVISSDTSRHIYISKSVFVFLAISNCSVKFSQTVGDLPNGVFKAAFIEIPNI